MELLKKKDRGADIKAGLFTGESNTWAVVWKRIIECVFLCRGERVGGGWWGLFTGFAQSCRDDVTSRVQQVRWESFSNVVHDLI